MGYVIKEVKPGVFELVFVEEAPKAAAKAEDEGKEDGDDEEKEEKEKPKEEEKEKPKEEEEEPLPVVDSGVLKSSALSRLVRDMKEIHEFPLPLVNAAPLENNMFEWHGNVVGSSDTVFCGFVFHLIMTFPEDYPVSPPKVRMMNYIVHPNVFGEYICLDMLEIWEWKSLQNRNKPYTGWTTAYSVQSILVQLQAFFSMEAYKDKWTEEEGVKRAQKSIDEYVCSCGHKKDHIWPPLSLSAIAAVKAEREKKLALSGKAPAKPAAGTAKPGPAKGKADEKKEEPEAEKEEAPAKKPVEKKEPEKEKQEPKAQKPTKPANQPLVTASGLLPLRRHMPGQGFELPVVGKRIGFGDRSALKLSWTKARQQKKFRDSEIEIKETSDGYVFELPINEPPPRSETKDIIYYWGEVYPVDEVDAADADPSVAARRAAGIPVVKDMTVGDILKSRPLNIPKQDFLNVVLNDNGGTRPFRHKTVHKFNTVYNLEFYQDTKSNDWKLYAIDPENTKNVLVLNLKSNKFNLHFLTSVQYFVHVEKKFDPKAEAASKGKKGAANEKGKRQPAKGKADGAVKAAPTAKPAPAKEGAAKQQGDAKAKPEQQKGEGKAGGRGAKGGNDAVAAPAQAGKGKGKAAQGKNDQGETEAPRGKRDQEEDLTPVRKYVAVSTPLVISCNFNAPAPISKEQRRRDRKGKDLVDVAPGRRSEGRGRGRTPVTAPVGTGKGQEGASDLKGKGKEKEEPKATEGYAPSVDGQVAAEATTSEKSEGQHAGGKGRRNRGGKGKAGPEAQGPESQNGAKGVDAAATKGKEKAGKKGEKQPGKGKRFNTLPVEIKAHIFSFLDKKDLYRVTSVNHEFDRLSRGILAQSELFCYHTKLTFKEDTLGIGVTYKFYPESRNIESISSTLDLLSYTAFTVDKVRKSVWKVRFHDWIPLYIGYKHGLKAVPLVKESICRILTGSTVGFEPKMAITIFTKLMNTMIVDLMKCDAWASEKALEGYFAFHHWLLYFVDAYPQLQEWVDETIGNFIEHERFRTKKIVPALGEFLPLLALTDKYSWKDIAEPYLLENFDRNQKWVLQKYPALGNLANEREPVDKTRIIKTQDATTVSQRLLMFHVYFLNHIAKPRGCSVKDMRQMYDDSFGRPSDRMKASLQVKIKQLQKISNWIEFFNQIEMPLPSPRQLTYWLRDSVRNSSKKRYHNRNDYVGKTRQKKKSANKDEEDADPYDCDF